MTAPDRNRPRRAAARPPAVSVVIPVYNGAASVTRVTDEVFAAFRGVRTEVILVNDGSADESEAVCAGLARAKRGKVTFVHLALNSGEHNAVMAGLRHSRGDFVVVMDDDGQNPPAAARELYDAMAESGADVAYGKYARKRHSAFRNLGSRFNDRVATLLLGKPPGLYLSSFKAMNRFIVDEILRYEGAFPYIDGLLLRATRSIIQVEVEHRPRAEGKSGYTLRKLFDLWYRMALNFSIAPLRAAAIAGLTLFVLSGLLIALIVIDKLWINPSVTVGLPTLMILVVFLGGLQLLLMGIIGEYLGRMFMDHSRKPQYVVRYVIGAGKNRPGGRESA